MPLPDALADSRCMSGPGDLDQDGAGGPMQTAGLVVALLALGVLVALAVLGWLQDAA